MWTSDHHDYMCFFIKLLPQTSVYAVALQFTFTGTQRLNHGPEWQCTCTQSKLHKDMICQRSCRSAWGSCTEHLWKNPEHQLQPRSPHSTSVLDLHNALVVQWTNPYSHGSKSSGSLPRRAEAMITSMGEYIWTGMFKKHIRVWWSCVHKPLAIQCM